MLFFIILILSLVVSYVLPWWIVAIIAFLAAFFISEKLGTRILVGICGYIYSLGDTCPV